MAVCVIAELFVIGRAAAVRALGRRRVARLRQTVEPVVDVGGAIILGVDDIAHLAIRRIDGLHLIGCLSRADRGLDLGYAPRIVIGVERDAVWTDRKSVE